MGVEFFEEKSGSTIPVANTRKTEGFAASLVSAGMAKSITVAQMGLAVVGILFLFGAYLVFSLGKEPGVHPPTQAEVQAMADLLRK